MQLGISPYRWMNCLWTWWSWIPPCTSFLKVKSLLLWPLHKWFDYREASWVCMHPWQCHRYWLCHLVEKCIPRETNLSYICVKLWRSQSPKFCKPKNNFSKCVLSVCGHKWGNDVIRSMCQVWDSPVLFGMCLWSLLTLKPCLVILHSQNPKWHLILTSNRVVPNVRHFTTFVPNIIPVLHS